MLSRVVRHAVAQRRLNSLAVRCFATSHKDIAFGHDGRASIARGVEKLTNAVSVTLGPKGRNVLIEQPYSAPKITKDGVTVAKSVTLENKFENIGARLLQDVANKTNEAAGDGTTTATVLAHAIYNEGLKALSYGCNPTDLRRGVQSGVSFVVDYLKANTRIVDNTEQIKHVATISANGDTHIGSKIAEAMKTVQKDGVITIKEGNTVNDTIEVTQGMRFDRGFVSPFFVTDARAQKCEYQKPLVLLSENRISLGADLIPAVEAALQARRPLLIIAEDIDNEALALLIVNKLRSALNVVAVRAPAFGDNRKAILHDMAVLTGAKVFSTEQSLKLESATLADLGQADSVCVTKDHTTIMGGNGDPKLVEERCAEIRASVENKETSQYDKERLQERLAKLTRGVAVVSVGGASEVEVGERKDRFVDSLHATRAAVEEGVLPGGGTALLRASNALQKALAENSKDLAYENADQRHGIDLVRRALLAPTRTIVRNAGGNGDFVIRMLTDASVGSADKMAFAMGYDAANERYVDMFEAGIIDPLKVVRTALVDASGVASLLTTSECIIVDAPKKEDPSSAAAAAAAAAAGGAGNGFGF